jgi:hypothetical protein
MIFKSYNFYAINKLKKTFLTLDFSMLSYEWLLIIIFINNFQFETDLFFFIPKY